MTTRQILIERLEKKKAQLVIVEKTYEELLAEPNESYRFDSGEGSQATKKRKLSDLSEQIDKLEAEIDGICRRLQGKGLTQIALRRSARGR